MCMRIYPDHPILVIFVIYVLLTCHGHPLLCHTCDLCAANMPWLLVWTFYSLSYSFSQLCVVNIPWLLACLFTALIWKMWIKYCHNPIFTHGIFSGVDTQNGTARTKPAWPDEASPHQILPWRKSGTHFPRFDQVWPRLTEVWPRFDRAVSNPTRTHCAQKPSRCGPGHISQSLEGFDQIRPSLTKVDQVWPRFDRTIDQTKS